VELPLHGQLLDRRRHPDPAHRQEGRRLDKLKGKKIALVYHDSPFGKEPIPVLQQRAKMHGFELQLLPVTAWAEQKATWLQMRQSRPDYVLLWGWGVMNSTALKGPGHRLPARQDVWRVVGRRRTRCPDVGEGAKGYQTLALNSYGQSTKVAQDMLKRARQGPAPARATKSARCSTPAA
jgi:branched-chain amino acid transport system substrate-binding protein